MTGAVPATWTCRPATTARENPATDSYGDPDEILRRSTRLFSPRGGARTDRVVACRRGRGYRCLTGQQNRGRQRGGRPALGVGDEDRHRARVPRRGGGGNGRAGRAVRAAGLDRAASARACLRPPAGGWRTHR